jgi:hypothetical protein
MRECLGRRPFLLDLTGHRPQTHFETVDNNHFLKQKYTRIIKRQRRKPDSHSRSFGFESQPLAWLFLGFSMDSPQLFKKILAEERFFDFGYMTDPSLTYSISLP